MSLDWTSYAAVVFVAAIAGFVASCVTLALTGRTR